MWLAIDTAGPEVGVALTNGSETWARTQRIAGGADALLLPWALSLCEEAGCALTDLLAVGVAAGPGTFTGVRVGLATASGLAFALGVPLVELGSLESRGARVWVPGRTVLVALDARKGRLYASWIGADGVATEPVDAAPDEVLAGALPGFVATGEGAVVAREAIVAAGGLLVDEPTAPAVEQLAAITRERATRGDGGDGTNVSPRYVRPPDVAPPKNLIGRTT